MRLSKKSFWKVILVGVFLQTVLSASFAQNKIQIDGAEKADMLISLDLADGVKSHKEIDKIYEDFSRSYETLNPEIVANLYTEDAAYLAPNNDITNGRRAILENFTGFFNQIKGNGQNMTISFQIFQRKVEKNLGYDVGIYTIRFYKNGKVIDTSKGKFVVVALKDKDKKWRFQVDGYSSLKPQNNN